LPNLRDVLFIGNPMYEGMAKEECRLEVLRRIPQVNNTHILEYT
jgi:dynein light chain 1